MSESVQFEESSINLQDYFRVIGKFKWNIVGLSVVITVLGLLVIFSLPQIYRSTATLILEAGASKVVSIPDLFSVDGNKRGFYWTQAQILKSRELAERVIDRLNISEHYEYKIERRGGGFSFKDLLPKGILPQHDEVSLEQNTDKVNELIRSSIVAKFSSNLSVEVVNNSQVVYISFDSGDPELAAKVPNALVDIYIESILESRLEMTRKATSWLTSRLENLRKNLEDSEKALQDYRERSGLIDVEGVRTTVAAKLAELTSRLVEARKLRAQAENIYNQVNGVKDMERLEAIPSVLGHPLVNQFKQNEADALRVLSELRQRYGDKHPKIVAAATELETIRANIRKQIRQIISGIKSEYDLAVADERAIADDVRKVELEVQEINRKEYELRVLERDVESNRQLYDMFLTRFKETSIADDMQSPIGRLVDPARPSFSPYKPNVQNLSLAVFVASVVFSIVLAFVMEFLDHTFKGIEDVERRLKLSLIGVLPLMRNMKENKSPQKQFLSDKRSNFSESVRTIRTGLLLSGLDNPHKVVEVTSSLPGEGKSTVAVNLALALAEMEKVLLLDADMRRPSVGKTFGFDPKVTGLSALVAGSAKASECIHKVEDTNLWILPSGIVPPNPLELLSSKRFADVLQQLGEVYDRIVIDSAPTQAVSDALVLSKHASALLYVVKADTTPYHVAQQGIKRLREVNAPLLGVVLNRVDIEKATGYGKSGYGYQGYYSSGYGSDPG